jgi:hypothetical protein
VLWQVFDARQDCYILVGWLLKQQLARDKLANDDLVGLGRFGEAAEQREWRRLYPGVAETRSRCGNYIYVKAAATTTVDLLF